MPDISMCSDKNCSQKTKCYRFTAIPNNRYQSYASFKEVDEKCDYFWDNGSSDCRGVKREGESCIKNKNCTYPNCN